MAADFGDEIGELLFNAVRQRASLGERELEYRLLHKNELDATFDKLLAAKGDEVIKIDFATETMAADFASAVREAGGECGYADGTSTVAITPNEYFKAAAKNNPDIVDEYPDVGDRIKASLVDDRQNSSPITASFAQRESAQTKDTERLATDSQKDAVARVLDAKRLRGKPEFASVEEKLADGSLGFSEAHEFLNENYYRMRLQGNFDPNLDEDKRPLVMTGDPELDASLDDLAATLDYYDASQLVDEHPELGFDDGSMGQVLGDETFASQVAGAAAQAKEDPGAYASLFRSREGAERAAGEAHKTYSTHALAIRDGRPVLSTDTNSGNSRLDAAADGLARDLGYANYTEMNSLHIQAYGKETPLRDLGLDIDSTYVAYLSDGSIPAEIDAGKIVEEFEHARERIHEDPDAFEQLRFENNEAARSFYDAWATPEEFDRAVQEYPAHGREDLESRQGEHNGRMREMEELNRDDAVTPIEQDTIDSSGQNIEGYNAGNAAVGRNGRAGRFSNRSADNRNDRVSELERKGAEAEQASRAVAASRERARTPEVELHTPQSR